MESILLGTTRSLLPKLVQDGKSSSCFSSSRKSSSCFSSSICCGLRGGARKPLWRGKTLSIEAIQAIQALKLARSSPSTRTKDVFQTRIERLIKADLVDVLNDLQRQNEWEIALEVFAFIQNEVWYKPDPELYSDMIFMLGKNKLIEIAEQLFSKLKEEGLQPDTRVYTEMIGAYLRAGMVDKGMDTYRLMKETGCNPDKLTLTILIRNLEKTGEQHLASAVRKDCEKYVDYPDRFLEEVNRKYPKRRALKLV
ncbi:pentatricopeptide repeat-containing protein-like isoform X1 [Iris pallida]|uniref:Pentatricopeptide repeat-containing protein-like isoform X1 n=1 Tax=Iris pallida TaxID=29817 RepID=A0AAX6GT23_IRIPA|nr:pentatricopeptide repeat-containing protein-like isoform X1 [Iris pallida]